MATTPDLSLIATGFVKWGGQLILKHLNEVNFKSSGIQVFKNVKAPLPLPKWNMTGEPRPYREQDDIAGNGFQPKDRVLTVNQSKWDMDIDPENFRNKYLNDGTKTPFAQFMTAEMARNYWSKINDNTLYLGVYNAAGANAASIATGWGTIIANEITGLTLTPVVTGAVTAANAVDSVEATVENLPASVRKVGGPVYVSWGTLDKYKKNYRTAYGSSFNKDEFGRFQLDNSKFWLQPESWMNTSQRIIATVDGNLCVGLDGEKIDVAASVRRNIIEARPMLPIGLQIADIEVLSVNDQV